jgi:hypothetical protein
MLVLGFQFDGKASLLSSTQKPKPSDRSYLLGRSGIWTFESLRIDSYRVAQTLFGDENRERHSRGPFATPPENLVAVGINWEAFESWNQV